MSEISVGTHCPDPLRSPHQLPHHAEPANPTDPGPPFASSDRRRFARRTTKGNRVLMFGRLRELALYRAAVLRDRGFDVTTPQDREEAVNAIRKGGYDIVVLTYTLSNETVQELAQMVRDYCPNCPLVAIVGGRQKLDREIGPDHVVNADDGPAALIAALRRVTRIN